LNVWKSAGDHWTKQTGVVLWAKTRVQSRGNVKHEGKGGGGEGVVKDRTLWHSPTDNESSTKKRGHWGERGMARFVGNPEKKLKKSGTSRGRRESHKVAARGNLPLGGKSTPPKLKIAGTGNRNQGAQKRGKAGRNCLPAKNPLNPLQKGHFANCEPTKYG